MSEAGLLAPLANTRSHAAPGHLSAWQRAMGLLPIQAGRKQTLALGGQQGAEIAAREAHEVGQLDLLLPQLRALEAQAGRLLAGARQLLPFLRVPRVLDTAVYLAVIY